MAKNKKNIPLDEHGNVRFDPMHKYTVRRTGKQIMRMQILIRIAAVIAAALFLFVLLLYLFSLFSTQAGRFTVRSTDGHRGLILSETADFVNYTAMLEAEPVENMNNITHEWLVGEEMELITETDGSHNGENYSYLAYTFYVKNTGIEDIDYQATIDIEYVKLAVDEAVRVELFLNGESTVYAKSAKDGSAEVDPQFTTVPFVDAVTVCDFVREDFVVDQIDKYTVLIYLEGEDPECVNDILGGELKMSMNFSVLDEDEGAAAV